MISDGADRTTKHEELTRQLRELLATLSPGERLPSQNELMRQFKVSDRTVLRSLDDLRRDGWIVRRRGSGTYVADPSDRVPLGFEPLAAADRRTVAALALSSPPSPFYHRCLDLLAQIAEESGRSLICHHAGNEPGGDGVLALEGLQPQGFIALNFAHHPVARRLQQRGHRVVILGAPPVDASPEVPCVYGDHERGAYLATRHVLDLGHRRFGYVRQVPSAHVALQRTPRWKGHERALREAVRAGHDVSCVFLGYEPFASWRLSPAAARAYFSRPDAPTALIAWNDTEAASALSTLTYAGIHVPGEVSIIGYDALPEGAECGPPLTTVDQHLETQLRTAMDLLSREVEPAVPQSVIIVPELLVRASCAPVSQEANAVSRSHSGARD